MTVQLNHTIVASHDPATSSSWWAELLGLEEPIRYGPFWQITVDNGVNFDFDRRDADDTINPGHYAFLIGEDDFDAIFGRIVERGIDHYADPMGTRKGEINHHDGGRGVYFPDPDGHWMEVITRPYGSGG